MNSLCSGYLFRTADGIATHQTPVQDAGQATGLVKHHTDHVSL